MLLRIRLLFLDDKIDLDLQDQHFRCLAHVFHLLVQDILKLMDCCEVEKYLDEEEKDYDDLDNIPDEEMDDFE
ncbi:hypothetical protein TKK_0007124 [Trichogramma kaykai]